MHTLIGARKKYIFTYLRSWRELLIFSQGFLWWKIWTVRKGLNLVIKLCMWSINKNKRVLTPPWLKTVRFSLLRSMKQTCANPNQNNSFFSGSFISVNCDEYGNQFELSLYLIVYPVSKLLLLQLVKNEVDLMPPNSSHLKW